MRFVSVLFAFVVLACLAGCGGSGPVEPAQVSAEEDRQLQEDQKKVDAAEQQQQAAQGRPQH